MAEVIKPTNHKPVIDVVETGIIPFSHEHRFVLRIADWRVPVINMRYEPFQSIRERLLDNRIWVRVWNIVYKSQDGQPDDCYHWACVDDGRIPQELYAKSLCWINYPHATPTPEIATEICNFAGLPHEAEQFTNPGTYWSNRGGLIDGDKRWVTLPA